MWNHRLRIAILLPCCALFLTGAVMLSDAPDPVKVEALGKALFHDKSLSNPAGMACVSCHDPDTGYSYPDSGINAFLGPVPGVIGRRFGNRRPPSVAYAPYQISGVPHFDKDAQAFIGGLFWDGRAFDATAQAKEPFLNPREMNVASPEQLVAKVKSSPSAALFKQTYGEGVFQRSTAEVCDLIAKSLVAYEKSAEVSPFTSKYDAYLEGKAELTPQELLGLRLATGTMNGRPDGRPFRKSAHCMDCHGLSEDWKLERDIWTNGCFANLGVPRNPYDPGGPKTVDLGLGEFLYPLLGLSPGGFELGDPMRINGTFKAPTLRNVDKRPYPGFVKAYMHNGVFKSLKQVVHFYNTRNMTTVTGEIIDFTQANPYANLKGKPLWAPPEYLSGWTLVNPTGKAAGVGANAGMPNAATILDPDAQQIGNLMLSDIQEEAIVAFLKTLSDGYFKR